MAHFERNAPCPCGSGLKHKRCCLSRERDLAQDAAHAERLWGELQHWALERFGDELGVALKGLMDDRGVGGHERPAVDGISRSGSAGFCSTASSRPEARRRSCFPDCPS